MADFTTNYKFEKPYGSENFRRLTFNDNMDKIDTAIGGVRTDLDGHLGDVVTAPLANKVLRLNASAKLPASITGDADTIDGCHAGIAANNVLKLDAAGKIPLANIPVTLTGISADTVDGCHAGTAANNVLKLDASGLVPLASIPTTGVNADTVDGCHAGIVANNVLKLDASGFIPLTSIPTTGVNADTIDGCHAGIAANNVLKLDASGFVPLTSIPVTLTGIGADTVDGCHAGTAANNVLKLDAAGKIPLANIPTTLTGINADTVDGLHAATFLQIGATTGTDGYFDKSTTTSPAGTSRLNYNGYLYAARVYNAIYNDYAEWFLKDEDMEPGDIVALNPEGEGYCKAKDYATKLVRGVYSDTYGQCLGGTGTSPEEQETTHVPLGLAGRVPVKIAGTARKGQYVIASSIPGVGVATDEYIPGAIVGQLEENKDTEETDRVWMFIVRC